MTERVDHAATAAEKNQYAMTKITGKAQEHWLASAQVHATLAVAEQLRIANVIAIWAAPSAAEWVYGSVADSLFDVAGKGLDPEIAAALGIEGETNE